MQTHRTDLLDMRGFDFDPMPGTRRIRASYRTIGGPDGLLARKVPFAANSMSAFERDGTYVVVSYATVIATWRPGEGARVSDRHYSVTTTRQQNLCRAWLGVAA